MSNDPWGLEPPLAFDEEDPANAGLENQAATETAPPEAQARPASESESKAPLREEMRLTLPMKKLKTSKYREEETSGPGPFVGGNMHGVVDDQAEENAENDAQKEAPSRQDMRPLLSDDDYTRKYPNDEYGAEMYPNARVWRTFIDERDIADKDYISDNNATLDGILVFASIFSAIVTTFVTQTYQSLVPDPQTASQGLLSELIAVQRVAANGSSVNDINDIPSYGNPSPTFEPDTADVWLNSLWFVSLMFSLLTAFLGVLAKQWLYQYMSVTSGTPRDRALVRQARNLGLYDWQVPALIGFLPIILHLSLALFFIGLIILLHSVLPNVAYFGVVLVGTVYAAYIVSNLLPVIYPRCPYRTALTPKIHQLYHFFPSFPRLHVGLAVKKEGKSAPWKLSQCLAWLHSSKLSIALRHMPVKKAAVWKDAERADALNTRGALEAKALSWLYGSSFNPTAQQVVLEAFAGLDPGLDQYEGSWDDGVIPQVLQDLRRECTRLSSTVTPTEDTDRRLELYLRALIQIRPFCPSLLPLDSRQKLALPHGIQVYLDTRKHERSQRLKTLVKCGLYDSRSTPGAIMYASSLVTDSELSDGIWTALIRQQNAIYPTDDVDLTTLWIIQHVQWHVRCLQFIRKAGFFTGTVHNGSPSMTFQNPNTAVCEAIFDSISRFSDSNSPTHVQALLHFLLRSLPRRRPSKNPSERIMLVLDCIMESIRDKISITDAWSSGDTKLFVDLISHSEQKEWNESLPFQWKTLWLLERFCMARHLDLIPTSVLNAWILPAMNTCLNGNRDWVEENKIYLQDDERVGLVLLRWAFDQQGGDVYDSTVINKFFWYATEWQRVPVRDSIVTGTLQILAKYLIAGVLTEKERAIADPTTMPSYMEHIINNIHQPDNLEALCQLLLVTSEAQEPGPLLRLLSLKPTHHAWSAAIVQSKHRLWKNGGKIYLENDYDTAVLQDLLAIQNILNIHAHNSVLDYDSLGALIWDGGEEIPVDNKILVAHRLASGNQASNDRTGLLSRWQNRLRDVFSFRKRRAVPEVELNQLP